VCGRLSLAHVAKNKEIYKEETKTNKHQYPLGMFTDIWINPDNLLSEYTGY